MIEKVIKALKLCTKRQSSLCSQCEYNKQKLCTTILMRDALKLLEEQNERKT